MTYDPQKHWDRMTDEMREDCVTWVPLTIDIEPHAPTLAAVKIANDILKKYADEPFKVCPHCLLEYPYSCYDSACGLCEPGEEVDPPSVVLAKEILRLSVES